MQEFTRSLNREITIDGERIGLNLGANGIALRPVGSRKPPVEISWQRILCLAVGVEVAGVEPAPDEISKALQFLKERKSSSHETTGPISGQQPHDDSIFEGILNRIQEWINHHRPRFAKGLQKGATGAEFEHAEHQLGRPLPPELKHLLSWHNGQDPKVAGTFERSFHLASVDEVVSTTRELAKDPPPGWHTGWLPFLISQSDSYIVVDSHQAGCPVYEIWNGKKHPQQAAPTLAAWLDAFSESLWGGAYVEDPERGDLLKKS